VLGGTTVPPQPGWHGHTVPPCTPVPPSPFLAVALYVLGGCGFWGCLIHNFLSLESMLEGILEVLFRDFIFHACVGDSSTLKIVLHCSELIQVCLLVSLSPFRCYFRFLNLIIFGEIGFMIVACVMTRG